MAVHKCVRIGDILNSACADAWDLYLPSPLGRFRVPGVGRQAGGHSRRLGHLVNFGSPAVPSPEQRPDRHRATSSPRRSGDLIGSRRSTRCGSQKWEPTCSAALGRSTTQSDSSRRSVAPHSTQSDGDRRPDPLRISLTRKRSLVQIQYGPRSVTWHFLSGSYQVAFCGPALAL
jgi:hypothetical protein